jgi:hypothetical protein
MESAMRPLLDGACLKAWRDSQGSLPKTGLNAYLDDNATEL